jgi:hypothetical protein
MILLVGPFVAVVGLVAIFFVMRRKSVDKRSMYSARRSQIEHKVRAARQRTLTPHGHAEKPAEAPVAAPPPSPTFAPKPSAPTITYQPAAYQPPPPAPAAPARPAEEGGSSMWDLGASTPAPPTPAPAPPPAPAAPAWTPPAEPEPYQPPQEEWTPGPAPEERVAPYEPARTEPPRPAERPSEPSRPVEPARPASQGPGWSIVGEQKAAAEPAPVKGHSKEKAAAPVGSWQLASGEAAGSEAAEEEAVKRPSGTIVALAQYAILVVGLVMVLIGVLVMVANSHPT